MAFEFKNIFKRRSPEKAAELGAEIKKRAAVLAEEFHTNLQPIIDMRGDPAAQESVQQAESLLQLLDALTRVDTPTAIDPDSWKGFTIPKDLRFIKLVGKLVVPYQPRRREVKSPLAFITALEEFWSIGNH
jgi:hypothetical protein